MAWERALAAAGDFEPERETLPEAGKVDPSPTQGALDRTDRMEYERLVALLVARGRLDHAAQLAREGLAAHPGAIELLLQLSRAEVELGHPGEAIAAAREAHRRWRSRDSLTHLLRLLTVTRRFTPEDGERLRRAVRKHRDAPALLQAAGMFEAVHGDRWAAIGLLRTALHLESDEGIRSEIGVELARLEPSSDRATEGSTRITGGR